MIRLACTNCKTVLLIDDAFAGGVCRCQHCGTIQTVPTPAKATPGVTVSGRAVGGVKLPAMSLSDRDRDRDRDRSTMPLSGTGLEELAGIVHSSGIAGSGLTSRRLTRPELASNGAKSASAAPGRKRSPLLWVLVSLATLGIAGSVFFAARAMHPVADSRPVSPPAGVVDLSSDQPPPPASVAGPHFCGVSLTGDAIVYLIDRGSGTKEIFPALEDATLHSVESLGPGKRFQILFWNNGAEPAGYPLGSTTYATPENLEAARRAIDAVAVFGASEVKSIFPTALASRPDRIVLVTPKGWSLSTTWADELLQLRGTSGVAVDTFSLGGGSAGAGLQRLASRTGGTFTAVTDAQLRAAGGS